MGRKKKYPYSDGLTSPNNLDDVQYEEDYIPPPPPPVVDMKELSVYLEKIIQGMGHISKGFGIKEKGNNLIVWRHSADILAAEFTCGGDGRHPTCMVFDYDLKEAIKNSPNNPVMEFFEKWN